MQGAYDNKTLVFMGEEAARHLSRSVPAIVSLQGHEVWVRPGNCPAGIATASVLDPKATPDLSCLASRKPQWVLPD